MILGRAASLLVKREWRDRYPGGAAFAGELFGIGLSLTVYWYMAKAVGEAIAPRLEGLAPDYFTYLVVGELVLLVPLVLATSFVRAVRDAQAEGTLDGLMLLPDGGLKALLTIGLAPLPREWARAAFTLLLAVALFGLRLDPLGVVGAIAVQVLALPACAAVGVAAAALFLRFGRGEGALSALVMVAAVVAGAYFPVSVFPEPVRAAAAMVSPYNAVLDLSRALLQGGWSPAHWGPVLSIAAWGTLGLTAAVALAMGSLGAVRRRGSVDLIRSPAS